MQEKGLKPFELNDKVGQAMSPYGLFIASGSIRGELYVLRYAYLSQGKEVIPLGAKLSVG